MQGALVSAVLHGSLTMADFRPRTSDLDLLHIVGRGLSSREAEALVEVVRAADLGPAGGLDLLVVTRRTAEAPNTGPARELLVGRWPGPGEEPEIVGREDPDPDLGPGLWEARAKGPAPLGPNPRDVIAVVPADRVNGNGRHWLQTWLGRTDDDKNAELMVLTARRMWRYAVEGEHSSKSAAARWALDRDPSLIAVDAALTARTRSTMAHISPDEVERVLLRVLAEPELTRTPGDPG